MFPRIVAWMRSSELQDVSVTLWQATQQATKASKDKQNNGWRHHWAATEVLLHIIARLNNIWPNKLQEKLSNFECS